MLLYALIAMMGVLFGIAPAVMVLHCLGTTVALVAVFFWLFSQGFA